MQLEIRETHRYVGTCQHLDRWAETNATAELLRQHDVDLNGTIGPYDEREYDMCEPFEHEYHYLVTPNGEPDARIERALRDQHTRHDCHHEHDCCGCRSYGVTAARKIATAAPPETADLWVVHGYSSRNF